jgi:hypothetical protein
MLIMRGMGVADDPDAPMVPSWAVDKPAVTVSQTPKGKMYTFEEPIVIDVKTGKPVKKTSWWIWVAAALGLVGAGYWYYTTQYKAGRVGRHRPKGRFSRRRAFAHA